MEAYFGLLLIGVLAFVILWAEGALKSRAALSEILASGVFRRVLLLHRNGSMLRISPVRL